MGTWGFLCRPPGEPLLRITAQVSCAWAVPVTFLAAFTLESALLRVAGEPVEVAGPQLPFRPAGPGSSVNPAYPMRR